MDDTEEAYAPAAIFMGYSLFLETSAHAEGPAIPDAEETFRDIAIDQFALSNSTITQKIVDISNQLQQRSQFEPRDIPLLTYVALNFNTDEMAKLEGLYQKTQAFCAADSRLAASCFLLDSAWKALGADSNEQFVQALEPYYQQMNDSSPKVYQLLVLIRWTTMMVSVKRYQKSLEMIHRALQLVDEMKLHDVYRVILYNNLSLIYATFGEYDRAMEYIQKTIELSEQQGFSNVIGHYYLNAASMTSKHLNDHSELPESQKQELLKKLRSFLDRAEDIDFGGVDPNFLLEQRGYAAYVDNDYKEARRLYEAVIKSAPNHENEVEAHLYIARIDLQEKAYEHGLREIELAAKILPADNDSLRTLFLMNKSALLRGAGRFEEAVLVYEELVKQQERTFREQLHSKFTQNLIDSSLKVKEDEARRMERELTHATRIKQLLILVFASLLIALVFLLFSVKQSRRLTRQNAYIIRQKDVIERQHQRMRMIFDNVQVGILEIDEEALIRGEHSQALSGLLQKSGNLEGQSLKSLLGGRMGMAPDREAMFWSSLDSILGEDPITWELNQQYLITEVVFEQRLLHFQWQPIIAHGTVMSMIILVSDVTLQKQLQVLQQDANEKAERQTRQIKELLLGSTEHALIVIRRLDVMIASIENSRNQTGQEQLLRDVHTLKGEARSCGLRFMQEACHLFEEQRDAAAFVQTLQEYWQLSNFWQNSESWTAQNLAQAAAPLLDEARRRLRDAGCEWLGFHVDDGIENWDDRSRRLLPTLLLHGITNAVDHGFMRPQQAGKQPRGARFSLKADYFEQGYRLQIRDSGCGIDHQKVQSLAFERRFRPNPGRPLTDVLFEDGVSTASEVNLTSGRGIGLSAVAAVAQELGGTARLLDNDEGSGSLLEITWPVAQKTNQPA